MKSVSRVNERLVNLQIEWRLSELLAIAHEHAALPHQPDGGAHGILIRCVRRKKAPHEIAASTEVLVDNSSAKILNEYPQAIVIMPMASILMIRE